jgi:hypothetical protein
MLSAGVTALTIPRHPPALSSPVPCNHRGVGIFRRKPREAITITDDGVSRTLATGAVESVAWDDLTEVRLLTTGDGPWADDVFWVLEGGDGGCVIPQSFVTEAMLGRLQALPGFENERMIEAMGSTVEAEFVCWRAR